MKNFSVRSSLLLIVLFSQPLLAKTLEPNECLKNLRTGIESIKYRASIDVLQKHLSGLLIFKRMDDSSIRAVFMNEVGATFFDITFYNDSYHYNYVMKSLDKKSVKKTVAKDLGMILMRGIYKGRPSCITSLEHSYITLRLQSKGTVRYTTTPDCAPVELIENMGRKKAVISVRQFYTAKVSMPDSIFVQHHTVHFTISLKQFNAEE
jgi:hypothetical protein